MEEIKNEYVRRSQKDYSMSFKLSVVSEVGRGEVSVTGAQKKYGIQGSPKCSIRHSTCLGVWIRCPDRYLEHGLFGEIWMVMDPVGE